MYKKNALLLHCVHCNVIICVILFYLFRIEYSMNLTEEITLLQKNLKKYVLAISHTQISEDAYARNS